MLPGLRRLLAKRRRALVALLSVALMHTGFAAELCAVEINHMLSMPSIQTPKCTALLFVPCLCKDLYHKFCWITSTLSYVLQ